MGVRGRLLLEPILKPAWSKSITLWSRSNSGSITIAATGPLSLALTFSNHDATWPDLGALVPVLTAGDSVSALVALDYAHSWRVVLGFDNGIVAVLDSDRTLLFCHVLHRDRVLDFRCRSQQPNLDRPDIVVRYQDRLVFLDGPSFTEICNRHVDYDLSEDEPEDDPLRYLQFHKFSVAGQSSVMDVVFCDTPFGIGRLLNADSHKFQFITVGSPSFNMIALAECNRQRPANEIIAATVRQGVDAARKIASSFFAFGKKILIDNTDDSPSENTDSGNLIPQPTKSLVERASTYTINPLATIGDVPNRIIQSILTDGSQQWAACVDNLGRILLLDLRQFLFIRIWKGYRDAQVAFLKDEDKTAPLMLLIYLSNLEILELWELPFGKRVTAKKIGKGHCLRHHHMDGPLLLASDNVALHRVSLDVNFDTLWRQAKAAVQSSESQEQIAAAFERIFRVDKSATIDSIIHATLCQPLSTRNELKRYECVSAALSLLLGQDKMSVDGLGLAYSLLNAYIKFGAVLLDSDFNSMLPFVNIFLFVVRDLPCEMELARAVFDPLNLGLFEAVTTFVKSTKIQESRLSECFLMWYWNAPSVSATNLFATEQSCFQSIAESSDIERALKLSESLKSNETMGSRFAPIASQLSDIAKVQCILRASSVFPVAVKFADVNETSIGCLNSYLGFVLAARINVAPEHFSDSDWSSVVSQCIAEFPGHIDESSVFLQCAKALFTQRNDLAGCIRFLSLTIPENSYSLSICCSIWRTVVEQLFSLCFTSSEVAKPTNLLYNWDDALALGDMLLQLISDKDSVCNVTLQEVRTFCILFRCARLASPSFISELGLLFPGSALSKPINLSITSQAAKIARRDFILKAYSDSSDSSELLQLASDLNVYESVMRTLIFRLMTKSPAHPKVISYLESRQVYIPALAAELTQRLHLLLVEVAVSLRKASSSRSKLMSTQAKAISSDIPEAALAWLEPNIINQSELMDAVKNRSIAAIGTLTSDSLRFSRSLLGYVSLAPATDSEVNNERVHEINRIVEAFASINDAIINQIGR